MTGPRARQPKLKHRQASLAEDEAFMSLIAPATNLATHKTNDEGNCRVYVKRATLFLCNVQRCWENTLHVAHKPVAQNCAEKKSYHAM
jgi:hypothetical protein